MSGEIVLLIALAPCVLAAAASIYAAIRTVRGTTTVPSAPPEPVRWPKLSLIVPACNEAETLEAAMEAKLACDYPDLEIVLVEDRSTDDTPRIADAIAARDARVRVVHVDHLPEGWLGKVHALDTGVRASTGEWFLLSDADVHLSPTILKRTIAQAEAVGHDFIPLIPGLLPGTALLDIVLSYFMRAIVLLGRTWAVSDPKSDAAVGGGAFMAVRRASYDASPGLSWMRLEIADDIVFGQMMKRAGARCAVYNAPDDVRVHFYRSVGEMMRGLEKNGFTVAGQYSLPRHVFVQSVGIWLEVGPWVALALPFPIVRAVAAGVVLALLIVNGIVARWAKRPLWSALVPCLGLVLFAAIVSRATVMAVRRGGISWRGTFYKLEDLRRATRVELPF